jgi:hypothetical protein
MSRTVTFCLFTLFLLPWAWFQMPASINGDTAWLIEAAQRLLNGGTVSHDFFEVNPPLSYVSLLPAVLIGKILHLSPVFAVYGYIVALIAFAAALISSILKRWEFLEDDDRLALIGGFLAGATIIPSVSFAEREQVLFLGLVPLALVQLSLTWGYGLPKKLQWGVLVFGAVCVLLKPHFGIIPLALLIHRAVVQRRLFSLVWDADSICLSLGVSAYFAFSFLFFPDYFSIVLPQALEAYLPVRNFGTIASELVMNGITFAVFLGIEAAFSPLKDRKKSFLMMLFIGALLCLIPYAVQMKGFYYHLIPAMGLFMCALAFSAQSYVRQYVTRPRLAVLILAMGLPIALAMMVKPPITTYPTHSDYKSAPLTQALEKNCAKPCSFFMFHDSIEVVHQTALYADAFHASRFASFWFLPSLLLSHDDAMKTRFSGYLSEDLERYHPSVLFILKDVRIIGNEPFDFVDYFSQDKRVADVFAAYEKTETIQVARDDYFRGTALKTNMIWTYDVYRLKDE